MARLHGQGGKVTIADVIIAGVTNWNIDVKGAADDATGMDSGGAKQFIAGLREWSGSLSGVWTHTGDGDSKSVSAAIGTVIALDLYPGKVGDAYVAGCLYTGSAIMTGFKPEVPVDGVVKWSMDFQGTGTLTYPTA